MCIMRPISSFIIGHPQNHHVRLVLSNRLAVYANPSLHYNIPFQKPAGTLSFSASLLSTDSCACSALLLMSLL